MAWAGRRFRRTTARRPNDCRSMPPPRRDPSYLYVAGYVDGAARATLLEWLAGLHPIWEMRYSTRRPPPPGREQRPLLRPVYWLGSWQFACLDYYRPPRGVHDRCVAAAPVPPVLATLIADIE